MTALFCGHKAGFYVQELAQPAIARISYGNSVCLSLSGTNRSLGDSVSLDPINSR